MAKEKASDSASESKNNALDLAIASIQKQFGTGSIVTSGIVPDVKFISTRCRGLDKALGGGWALGRIIEIFGPESSGKTTLTLEAIASAQSKGLKCAFIDMEHAFDPQYALAIGVKMNELIFSQPSSGEEALEITDMLVRSGAVSLIIIDSVAALVPQKELEGDMGDSSMGKHALLMSQAMRKLAGPTHQNDCSIIFINQIRMKLGVMFGSPETTTGGNGLKFYASQRVDVRRRAVIKDGTGDDAASIGNETEAKVIKNKVAPPFKSCTFAIYYGRGIDKERDLLESAIEAGAIIKGGAWFTIGEQKIQGEGKMLELLKNDEVLRAEIIRKLDT